MPIAKKGPKATINSPFKDRVVSGVGSTGQGTQMVGPADLVIGITLPGSTSQGMVTSLVKK